MLVATQNNIGKAMENCKIPSHGGRNNLIIHNHIVYFYLGQNLSIAMTICRLTNSIVMVKKIDKRA